jgi:DNA-binding cell septation regulator SpoVG
MDGIALSLAQRPNGPTYPLTQVLGLVRSRRWKPTDEAIHGAASLEMDVEDIRDCVLGLTLNEFYKTMPSERLPGTFQDVYHPEYSGQEIYVKVQVIEAWATVVQFKER